MISGTDRNRSTRTRLIKSAIASALVPVVRTWVRYLPGKTLVWRVAEEKIVWRPRDFCTRTIFGARFAGNTRDYIQRHIYYFGCWEPNLTSFLISRLKPGQTFVDVGANIGYFSLLASRCVGPSGKVVAIEASPKIFRVLSNHVARNRCQNIRVVNLAASAQPGWLTIYAGPDFDIGLASTIPGKWLTKEAEVEAAPLDEILTEDEVRSARILKIDVERGEASVVAGMQRLFTEGSSDLEIVIELSPGSANDVVTAFAEHGFHAYSIANTYKYAEYLSSERHRPVRVRESILAQTDVVFSPVDADRL